MNILTNLYGLLIHLTCWAVVVVQLFCLSFVAQGGRYCGDRSASTEGPKRKRWRQTETPAVTSPRLRECCPRPQFKHQRLKFVHGIPPIASRTCLISDPEEQLSQVCGYLGAIARSLWTREIRCGPGPSGGQERREHLYADCQGREGSLRRQRRRRLRRESGRVEAALRCRRARLRSRKGSRAGNTRGEPEQCSLGEKLCRMVQWTPRGGRCVG